jgi:hypothetical protein
MITIEQLLGTLNTDSGFWNPLTLILVFIITYLIIYIISGINKKEGIKKKRMIRSIPVADEEYEQERKHMKDCNLYWDFVESVSGFLVNLNKIHSGGIKDYLMWFLMLTGVLFILMVMI